MVLKMQQTRLVTIGRLRSVRGWVELLDLCCKLQIYQLQYRQETVPVPCAVIGVGMLSSSELEGSMMICNTLKSPTQPVWV